MKKSYYQVKGWIRFSEEDIYQDGCQPNTGGMFSGDQVFRADSIHELLQNLLEFTGADFDALELNACGEAGRIDISLLEDEYSSVATRAQISEWKAGKIKLWNSIYSFNAEYISEDVEAVDFDLVEA